MKPRLLLDSDNVISDFVRPFLDILERLTGNTYAREDVSAYDITKSLEIPEYLVKQAYLEAKLEGFCTRIPAFPGAKEGVARLKEVAHVFVVTSPIGGLYWEGERRQWLYHHFDINSKNVVSSPTKYIIAGDIFVDDKTSALAEWERFHDGIAVQWITPHNLDDGWMGVATNNWTELLGIVKAVGAQKRPHAPVPPQYIRELR